MAALHKEGLGSGGEEEEEGRWATDEHAGVVLLNGGWYACIVDKWGNESWHELVLQIDDTDMHGVSVNSGCAKNKQYEIQKKKQKNTPSQPKQAPLWTT